MPIQQDSFNLFFDGAFGTYYTQLTSDTEYCELANLTHPEVVYSIHKDYLGVGVTAIKTNTFGANSLLFEPNELKSIITRGFQIATDAASGTNTKVFADIGYIHSDSDFVISEYTQLADYFIECGAKYFLFETFAEYEVLVPTLAHIKKHVPDAYIIVSFAVTQDGYSQKGHYYKNLIQKAAASSFIDAVGLNCICGPSHFLSLIKELDLTHLNFSAMPNAGYPSTLNGRIMYQDNAEYFSQKLTEIAALGVKIIGGCCGTTPEHIKLTLDKLSTQHPLTASPSKSTGPISSSTPMVNAFESLLGSSKKVIAVELDPPLDTDCSHIISAAKALQAAGADIITIADSPLARTRADSLMLAAKVKREVGVEVLPHLTCRDKNHIGIKGSLLGAHIEGVHNVLAITGDPVAPTDRAHCKGVFNFNSQNLISFIESLNTDVFAHAPFYIGGALNVNVPQFESELKRAGRKLANGASFLLTQPIFSDESIENLYTAYTHLDGKLLAGILPFASYRNALFLNNEVSGIDIPTDLVESLKDKTPEEVLSTSLAFSTGIIQKVYHSCDGFYLMTPLKKTELICHLIQQIRSIENDYCR